MAHTAMKELRCRQCGREPRLEEAWRTDTCPDCRKAGRDAWVKDHWRRLIAAHGAMVLQAPHNYAAKSFENWEGAVPEACEDWLRAPNTFLLVYGPVGCGKTHLATATAVRWVLENGPDPMERKPLWIDAQQMVEQMKPGGPEDILERVTQACLLVLDDLGVERQDSMFGPERVRFVIRARHMDGLPTIVTSNMGPKEIKAKLDERMGSRLGSGFRVHLTGRDRRG